MDSASPFSDPVSPLPPSSVTVNLHSVDAMFATILNEMRNQKEEGRVARANTQNLLQSKIDALSTSFENRMTAQDKKLESIEKQTKDTNDRVSVTETAIQEIQKAKAAISNKAAGAVLIAVPVGTTLIYFVKLWIDHIWK